MIIPEKLKSGDEIRVIAPSRSMAIISKDVIDTAKHVLEEMGFKVTFGNHIFEDDSDYHCGTIEGRVKDLEEAFKDKNVKCIMTAIGGYNINQILGDINYEIIKENPKILCGFSDITALQNAIFKKTELVTYYGPHFSSFGMKKGIEYTKKYFLKMIKEQDEVTIEDTKEYSDDAWYIDQENRNFIKNNGSTVFQEGKGEGYIIGGNLCTLNLLQGTEFFPDMKEDIIWFLEDDAALNSNFLTEFDRNLESLMGTNSMKHVKGIVIGRAQIACEMTKEKWCKLLSKKKLKNIPIIFDSDFGHTTPIYTFPIGGYCKINTKEKIKIKVYDKNPKDKVVDQILNNKEIIDIYEQIANAEKVNGWASHSMPHIRNVMNMSEYLLRKLNYSNETIRNAKIAAFLHDIGCIGGKEDHASRGYEMAKEFFKKNNIKLENEKEILDAIKNHSNGYDSNNIITRTLLISDKLDIAKDRVVGIGGEVSGMKELLNIDKIETKIIDNNLLISFKTNKKLNQKELEDFYFIKKVFKSIKSFAEFNELNYLVTLNGKRWEL